MIELILKINKYGFIMVQERSSSAAFDDYNIFVRHETLRVAVLHTLQNAEKCQLLFRDEMEEYFLKNYSVYVKICQDNAKYDHITYEVRSFDQ